MPPAHRLSRALVWGLAVSCGLSVANLYYNQPLHGQIARTLHATVRQVGAVAFLTQIGYALGMLLFVPLGNAVERRRLIVLLLMAVTVAMAAAGCAPRLGALACASLFVGVTTVVPQLLVPLAAGLAAPRGGGRTMGAVMSGLLFGILLARTVSGFVGTHLGWRAMFWIVAGLMALLAVALRLSLPPIPSRAAIGALVFGAFSAFWTALVFLLQSAPYHFAHASQVAGLFGLGGVAGAAAASLAGRLADERGHCLALGVALSSSFVVFWRFGHSLWGLGAGVLLLDFGTQGVQVSNQSTIYGLTEHAHSRLNTVYMVTYFAGGALGATLATVGWSVRGWTGVCAVALLMQAVAVIVFSLGGVKRARRTPRR